MLKIIGFSAAVSGSLMAIDHFSWWKVIVAAIGFAAGLVCSFLDGVDSLTSSG